LAHYTPVEYNDDEVRPSTPVPIRECAEYTQKALIRKLTKALSISGSKLPKHGVSGKDNDRIEGSVRFYDGGQNGSSTEIEIARVGINKFRAVCIKGKSGIGRTYERWIEKL